MRNVMLCFPFPQPNRLQENTFTRSLTQAESESAKLLYKAWCPVTKYLTKNYQ